jgi:hypothetical protein
MGSGFEDVGYGWKRRLANAVDEVLTTHIYNIRQSPLQE